MLRKILVLAAAAALLSAPALAQRGGGHGSGGGHQGGGHQGGGAPGHGSGGGGNHGPSGGGSWGGGGNHNGGGGSWGGGNNHNGGGGGWNNNNHHDDRHDWDRGRSNGGRYRSYNSFALGLTLGSLFDPYPYGYDSYRSYSYAPAWNAWGLAPYECRWDTEFSRWYGRPADVQVKRCADAYGNVYVVQESQRLWRYR